MSESRWMDMVGGYVLDVLEPGERQAFEEQLTHDADLRAEVDAQAAVVDGLSDTLPRVAPRSGLKDRILTAARSAAPPPSGRSVDDRRPDDGPRHGRGDASPPVATPPRRTAILPWFAAAAAFVVAVGLGVLVQRSDSRRASLETQLAAVEATLESMTGELAERDSLLATFLGPDVRTASLSATGQPPSARLFWNTGSSTLLVTAFDLPPAPEGRVYQLWGIPAGAAPVSLGTFQTDPDGTAVLRREAPDGADFQIGAVTEEPAGGSPQPTTAPFLVGSWSAAQ